MLRAGALLALGGAAVPLTGCDLFDRDDQPAPPPDPLRPMVDESLALAATYRASATAHPELADRLSPIAEAHTAHATELARVIGVALPSAVAAPPSDPANDPASALAALRRLEKTAQQSATVACAAAPAERAALLGSIAAARATHQEALK
ncbi:hypothetical protein [Micromonospora parathelypteridis]|uniref:hypothetical protein n=1 Tax=Micromonospora parathelypteridis TaxID=1839617 RepID=UPI00161522F1|nr:hypothetical protein [Micromonospora parathelypteridis]